MRKASSFSRWLVTTQLSIDPRTLGATRIALASLLLFDLASRFRNLETWYVNSGLLPNHTLLWSPVKTWQLSLLFPFSYAHEVAIAFGLIGLVYLALLVGYRTRIAQVLSLIALISLQVRVDLLSNGGDFVGCALLWWTVFLPMGERFSLDAVRQSLAAGPETPEDVQGFAARPRNTQPIVSLAVFALMMQLAIIYFFNAIHKDGPTWREGSAIHYLIQQERILTPVGLLARQHLPFVVTQVLSYATLVIEWLLPFLILSPIGRPWTRRLAFFLLVGLHTNIALLANLSDFSAVMCIFGSLLVTSADWDALERWLRGTRRRIVWYDAGCGVCFQLARILARLDLFARLDLRAGRDAQSDELPAGVNRSTLDDTLVVIDPETGKYRVESSAWAECIRSLPLGLLVSWVLWIPGLRQLNDRLYGAFSRNRAAISQFLGYAACGITPPSGQRSAVAASANQPATGLVRQVRRLRIGAREAAVLLLIVIATAELLADNRAIPDFLRIEQRPDWITASIGYTRLNQGWSMFAPDAPRTETNIVVEAHTVSGRSVDPIRAASTGSVGVEMDRILIQPGYNGYWISYLARIPQRPAYSEPLHQWLLAYDERTGNPLDKVMNFTVWRIEQDSPAPGEDAPDNVRRTRLTSHP